MRKVYLFFLIPQAMKRFFASIILLFLFSMMWNTLFAATQSTPLSVTSVKVTDNKNIRINFSEEIDAESVVLKILKQSDNSTVKLDSITLSPDSKTSVDVVLDDPLVEASSYTLTVIAGIAKSGSTITDGAAALQDFITPSPLKVASDVVLNAPSNPNAVITPTSDTKTATQSTQTIVPERQEPVKTPVKVETPAPTEELPLTGPNSLFFLIIALPLAYIFLKRKSA